MKIIHPIKLKLLTIAVVSAAVLLTGCARGVRGDLPDTRGATANQTLPTVQENRITDEAIRADHRGMSSLQERLKNLNTQGVRKIDDYDYAKAQCWLDFGFDEYHDNDRTGVVDGALDQAKKLISGMEAKTTLSNETPIIPGSKKLREDLWAKAAGYKTQPGFQCAAATVACMEVQLVHAGHEDAELGWRHAELDVSIAEKLDAKAKRLMDECAQSHPAPVAIAPVVPPPVVVQAPAPAPIIQTVTIERYNLMADALFNYDRYDLANLRPEGKARLDNLAARLKTMSGVEAIKLTGHADRLGGDNYNQRLSERRAETVRSYLVSQGVDSNLIQTSFRGETEPLTTQCSGDKRTKSLIECLQADRRVEIEVMGVSQRR
ncbi:MAG: OmpA family protein [Burkholderiales bacterium]